MKYIHDTTEFRSGVPTAVTLGKFDGLHRGHQKLIREISHLQDRGYCGVVFTIAPDDIPALLMPEEKRAILESWGMDSMIRCPYIPEVLGMEPESFISEILVECLKARYVVVGTDFRFGYRRRGDVELLLSLQQKYGYTVKVIKKECHNGREISSTYVREALTDSNLPLVNELLGFSYPIRGTVEHGKQLGRRMGMPTINQIPDKRKLLPENGVYFSEAVVGEKRYRGITNIGSKPTVDGSFMGVETYLYGAAEDLYGREAEIRLLKFRRPEQRFASVEELKNQMEKDLMAGEEFFREQ